MNNVIDFSSKKKSKDELKDLIDALELRCQCGNDNFKLLIMVDETKLVIECAECGIVTDFNVMLSEMLKNAPDSEIDDEAVLRLKL
jgi:hypothetical protein